MPGRFPLLTDEHIRQPLIETLISYGWDVLRAVDVFPEGTDDEILFEYAARHGRVFVSCDEPAQKIPRRWLEEGRAFRGMICWPMRHHRRMSEGDFLRAFEDLANEAEPFAWGVRHISPE